MNTINESGVAELPARGCWELLQAATIGRLAIVVATRPEIFPVNFVVDHDTVVFRSAPGTKLSGLRGDTSAAFEVDGESTEDSTAWSVVIHGHLEPLISFEPITTDDLPLYPLQAGAKPQFVRIVPLSITGRRFSIADPETWRVAPELGRPQLWE